MFESVSPLLALIIFCSGGFRACIVADFGNCQKPSGFIRSSKYSGKQPAVHSRAICDFILIKMVPQDGDSVFFLQTLYMKSSEDSRLNAIYRVFMRTRYLNEPFNCHIGFGTGTVTLSPSDMGTELGLPSGVNAKGDT